MISSSPKPQVFIASSREHLELARAVQQNLQHDCDPTVWDQDVFDMSDYHLDILYDRLVRSDFGIFVLAPADSAVVRGRKYAVPRDNVIFELGMFVGGLGRKRSFFIIPRKPSVKLPNDLDGLVAGDYDQNRADANLEAALGPVCTRIRRLMLERFKPLPDTDAGMISSHLFSDYTPRFDELLASSPKMTLFFVHSRRWRENHHDALKAALERNAQVKVFLPDLTDSRLTSVISGHFDDESHVPSLIGDAYRYFAQLKRSYSRQVSVRLCASYPAYSFYGFDTSAIVALYPNARIRQGVPSFEVSLAGRWGAFFISDIENVEQNGSRNSTRSELEALSLKFASPA